MEHRTRSLNNIGSIKELLKWLLIDLVYNSRNCEVNDVLSNGFNARSLSGRYLMLGEFNVPTEGWKNLKTESSRNPLNKRELMLSFHVHGCDM